MASGGETARVFCLRRAAAPPPPPSPHRACGRVYLLTNAEVLSGLRCWWDVSHDSETCVVVYRVWFSSGNLATFSPGPGNTGVT